MRWSLFSRITAAVLALTATAVHDAAEDEPAIVPLSCPELIRLLRALMLPPPVRDRDHVLHWTAGDAITKLSRPPATSNDTTDYGGAVPALFVIGDAAS
ncbi:hypothetical protein [Streptomyces sp. NBC_00079]|uniref:hypothetical protein n=1 Tax=Streptomyces sp. NBC_00079 TaxID=2975644 RepID=UPI0032481127